MARNLLLPVMEARAKFYAQQWLSPDATDPATGKPRWGPKMVLVDMQKLAMKDAFDAIYGFMSEIMGKKPWAEFEKEFKKISSPRTDEVFAEQLKKHYAIDTNGNHIDGAIGSVRVGGRRIGTKIIEHEPIDGVRRRKRLGLSKEGNRELVHKIVPLDWPIYAGEEEERARNSGVADRIPGRVEAVLTTLMEDEAGALNTSIGEATARVGLDALLDELDSGTKGAVIEGYITPQAADPDAAATPTRLFKCNVTSTTVSFAAATDAGDPVTASCGSITDDSSAEASGTLLWCRGSSCNTLGVSLDAKIDGEAATSGADWTFNTLAIVTAATVSITSWTVSMPQS